MLLNNRFKVIKQLGQGGFGETFLAEDTHMPSQRRCVIKQLRPEVPNQKCYDIALRKFQEEAAILEELDHPQIPRLYGYFEQDEQFYLSQQWIDGQTLGQKVMVDGPMQESEVISTMTRLLPVFAYLHAHKVVHRDVKPDNIVIRQRDGLPVLIDFGSVKQHLRTTMSPSGGFTCSVMIGTEGFAAPEQSAQRIVYSSDLYGLGITCIYLLTGKLPQEIDKDIQTGEILWHSLAPSVTPELKAIIDKSTEFSPRDRYFSAEEMMQSLRAIAPQKNVATELGSTPHATPFAPDFYSPSRASVVSNTHPQDPQVASTPAASSPTNLHMAPTAVMPVPSKVGTTVSQDIAQDGSQQVPQKGLQNLPQNKTPRLQSAGIKPVLNRSSALGATVIDSPGILQWPPKKSRKLLAGVAGLTLAVSSLAAFYLGTAVDHSVNFVAAEKAQSNPENKMAQMVAQYKAKGNYQAAVNKSFEFLDLGFPDDSKAAKDVLEQFADMTVLPLGEELDQVLNVQNYEKPPERHIRSLLGFGATGLSDVDNRTSSKKLKTALGISAVNVYPAALQLPVNWPKYEHQPDPSQWTEVTSASWHDPWRETYAFDKMELRVLYGCMTNIVLQNSAVFDREATLPYMQVWLKKALPNVSKTAMKKLEDKLVGIYEGNLESDDKFTTVDGNVQLMIMKDAGKMVIASRII